MKSLRWLSLLSLVAISLLFSGCSLESRNLGGPTAIGGKPPTHGLLGIGFAQDDSLLIKDVVPGSSAEEAAIQGGDTLISIDGREMKNRTDLLQFMKGTRPGVRVEVMLKRDDQTRTVSVRLISYREWADLARQSQLAKEQGE